MNGTLLDSGQNALVANSNLGVGGRHIFDVSDGNVAPAPGVPAPATWAMMIGGFALAGAAARQRGRQAAVLA